MNAHQRQEWIGRSRKGHRVRRRQLQLELLESRRLLFGDMFPSGQEYVGSEPVDVHAADFDLDGDLDIVSLRRLVSATPSAVSIFLNNGDGTYQPRTDYAITSSYYEIATADFNSDNYPDVAVVKGSSEDAISVFLNQGDGTLGSEQSFTVANDPTAVATGDVNKDGITDIVSVSYYSYTESATYVSVLLGNGDGTFAEHLDSIAGTSVHTDVDLFLGDFDGDGNVDVATTGGTSPYTYVSVAFGDGAGSFNNPVAYAATGRPGEIYGADLDGNGSIDLAVANQDGRSISVFLNQGDGTLAARTDYSLGTSTAPGSIRTADLNGDSRTDLVVACSSHFGDATTIAVLLGLGGGVFGSPTFYPAGDSPRQLTIADFDGDLKLDVAVTNSASSTITTLFGQGDGTFAPTQIPTEGGGRGLYSNDLDGDGHLDLVIATTDLPSYDSPGVLVTMGDGSGNFTLQSEVPISFGGSYVTPTSLAGADMDGDGIVDLIVGGANGRNTDPARNVAILPGNGDGTFGSNYNVNMASDAWDAIPIDVNRDGLIDLVAVNQFAPGGGSYTPYVAVALKNADGTFAPTAIYTVGDTTAKWLTAADLNGDGFLDLATGGYYLSVFINNKDGTYAAPVKLTGLLSEGGVTHGDFNGDGFVDLAKASGAYGVIVALGNGDGSFQTTVAYTTTQNPREITSADVNGDGHTDLVVANGLDNFSILLGNGDGTFESAKHYATGASPRFPHAADFNRDGFADVAISNSYGNTVSVFMNSPGFINVIDTPRRSGDIVQGDTLFLTGHGSVPDGEPHFIWDLGDGRTITAEDPGLVSFHSVGDWEVSFVATDSTGFTGATPAVRNLQVHPDTGDIGDLVVAQVTTLTDLAVGAPATLRYRVNNSGSGAVVGNWTDAVYLSEDDILDANDLLLASVQGDHELAIGQGYTTTLDVVIPGIRSEAPYLIVSVDDTWEVLELHQLNNEHAIATDLGMPWLLDETPWTTAFEGAGTGHVYRVEIPEGDHLLLNLDDFDNAGFNELYVRHGSPPTRGTYDYRYDGPASADVDLLVRAPAPGVWYVLAYAASTGIAGDYQITANTTSMVLFGSTPDSAGNLSQPVLRLSGAGFDATTTAVLVAGDGQEYQPLSLTLDSPSQMTATFEAGLAEGVYTVRVEEPSGDQWQLPNALELIGGEYATLAALDAQLLLPGSLGFHNPGTFYVEYTNTASLPMRAPLLVVRATQEYTDALQQPIVLEAGLLTLDPWRLVEGVWAETEPEGFGSRVSVLASGQIAGWLQPGETARVPVYWAGWQPPWQGYPFQFYVGPITTHDTTPIDWPTLKEQMQPDSIPDDAWDAIWSNFQAQVGSTWGQWVAMLDTNAEYLGRLGSDIVDVRALTGFELLQAGGLSPVATLDYSVDLDVHASGLSLTFARSYGQPIAQRYQLGPLGRGWRHQWQISLHQEADRTVVVTDADGSTRRFEPDLRGGYLPESGGSARLIDVGDGRFHVEEPDGTTVAFRADGLLEYVQDRNLNRINLNYLPDGRLSELQHSDGRVLSVQYTGDRITQIADPYGRTVQYQYDPSGEYLVTVLLPDGREVRYDYETAGTLAARHALTEVTHPDGSQRFLSYDSAGRLMKVWRTGDTEVVDFSYDSNGTVTSSIQGGETLVFSFGHLGEVRKVVNSAGISLQMDFDETGRLNHVSDSLGRGYAYEYDASGYLTKVTSPVGATTFFARQEYGDIVGVTDAAGNRTSIERDALGNATQITYLDGTFGEFQYDTAGNVDTIANRRGDLIDFTYDAYGRLVRKDYPDGTFVEYLRAPDGRITEATDAGGTTTIDYDTQRRVSRITYPGNRYLDFTYDAAGRRDSMTDQTGHQLNYVYDARGYLTEVTDQADQPVVSYVYDDRAQMIEKRLPNGSYTTYDYDLSGRLIDLTNRALVGGNETILSRFVYTYDQVGRRTSMETTDGLWSYRYDGEGRLVHASFDSQSPTIASQELTYVYDGSGNRVRVIANGISESYVTDEMNRYTQINSTSYEYDDDGNLIAIDDGVLRTEFSYDAENRVTDVDRGTDHWHYDYNALGHRVATTLNGVTTYHLIDPGGLGNMVSEYNASGDLLNHYDHGLGLISIQSAGQPASFFAFDGTGNTAELTDAFGAVLNEYHYSPFGKVLSETTSVPNPFLFAGDFGAITEPYDLVTMRARQFDPHSGRFTSEDPIGIPGLDTYTYAANAPTTLIDPAGLTPVFWDTMRAVPSAVSSVGSKVAGIAKPIVPVVRVVGAATGGYEFGQGLAQGDIDKITHGGGKVGLIILAAATMGTPAGWIAGVGLGICTAIDLMFPDSPEPNVPSGWTPRYDAYGNLIGYTSFDPPVNFGGAGTSESVRSVDPNQKLGPAGYGSPGFVQPGGAMSYRIDFENDPLATAPAQYVTVMDQLDTNLDWSTFELTEIGFGDHLVSVPNHTQHFESIEVLNVAGEQLEVHVKVDLNVATGLIAASFSSIDPDTGLPPEASRGFLLPEDGTGAGQGHFSYVVEQMPGLVTGTEIRNVAVIQFDFGETIATNQIDPHDPSQGTSPDKEALVTIDAGAPSSHVNQLPEAFSSSEFEVTWTGEDDPGGSGIASYDIFVSVDGGDYQPWLQGTSESTQLYTGAESGSTYAFKSVARDHVGHLESLPVDADAQTLVLIGAWINPNNPYDVNDVDGVTALDALLIINELARQSVFDPVTYLLDPIPPDGYAPPFYDVTMDGKLTALDALRVINEMARQSYLSNPAELLPSTGLAVNREPEAEAATREGRRGKRILPAEQTDLPRGTAASFITGSASFLGSILDDSLTEDRDNRLDQTIETFAADVARSWRLFTRHRGLLGA